MAHITLQTRYANGTIQHERCFDMPTVRHAVGFALDNWHPARSVRVPGTDRFYVNDRMLVSVDGDDFIPVNDAVRAEIAADDWRAAA